MGNVPITHFFDWNGLAPDLRRLTMREFAANGARHLVLGHTLMVELLRDPRLIVVLPEEAAAAGLSFLDAHAPFSHLLELTNPDDSLRPVMMDTLRTTLRIAGRLGTRRCSVHVGAPHDPSVPVARSRDLAARALAQLLPVAEESGVVIAVENIWSPTELPETLLSLVDEFRSDHLGICYDAGHANIMARGRESDVASYISAPWEGMGPIPRDDRILEKLLPHVVTCHLHDNDGTADQHLPPGRGTVDWKRIVGLLRQAPKLASWQNETNIRNTDATIAGVCRTFADLTAL